VTKIKFYRVKEGKHFAYLTAPTHEAAQFTIRRDLDPDVKYVRWTITFPGQYGWDEVLDDTNTLKQAKRIVHFQMLAFTKYFSNTTGGAA
jgi:hypothetical protein